MASTSEQGASRVCTLWVHGGDFSRHDVVINTAVLPSGAMTQGSLWKLVPLEPSIGVQDFQQQNERGRQTSNPDQANRQPFVFTDPFMEDPRQTRHPALQISVCEKIASLHGLRNRMSVNLTKANEPDHAATHVELIYRDKLNRADLWKMSVSELRRRRCIYQGQCLLFLGSIKITVRKMYVNGQKVPSAVFSDSCKPVFRSESAKFVIAIQLSREMWGFDQELSGDILWTKAADFLQQLFERWVRYNSRHKVTIVFFARMQYEMDQAPISGRGKGKKAQFPQDHHKDFYRTVANEVSSSETSRLLEPLSQAFLSFQKDAQQAQPLAADGREISGKPTLARHGNVLEALNLALSACSTEHPDLEFKQTESSIVVVTPGTAVFDVEEQLLRLTTQSLASRTVGVELVCLSHMPLHVTPLFCMRYRSSSVKPSSTKSSDEHEVKSTRSRAGPDAQGRASLKQSDNATDELMLAIPSWIEVSFYLGSNSKMNELSKTEMNAVFPSKWKSSGLEHAEINEIHRDYKLPPSLQQVIDAPLRTESRSDIKGTTGDESSVYVEPGHPSGSTVDRKEFKWMGQHDRDIFTAESRSASTAAQPKKPSPTPSQSQTLHIPKHPEHQVKEAGKKKPAVPSNAPSAPKQGSVVDNRPKASAPKVSLAPPFRGQSIGKAVATTSSTSTSANFSSGPSSFRIDPNDDARYWSSQVSASLSKTGPRSQGREQPPPFSDNGMTRGTQRSSFTSKNDTKPGGLAVSYKPPVSTGETLDLTSQPVNHGGPSYPWKVQLEREYSKAIHRITLHEAEASGSMRDLRAHVARELIQWRLSEGFQVAVGRPSSQTFGKSASRAVDFFTEDFMTKEGATITVVKGDSVHELYAIGKEIVIAMYQRLAEYAHALKYSAVIRTIMESQHHERHFSIRLPVEIDWNAVDEHIAEYESGPADAALDNNPAILKPRSMRLVVIPCEIPGGTRSSGDHLADEDIRMEGIRKLTLNWQKYRYTSPLELKHKSTWKEHDDPNPLAIEYHTRDPSAIVAAGHESSLLMSGEPSAAPTQLFSEEETYRTSHFDLQKLAGDLQGEKGIPMNDRRWHFRTFPYCFVGVDFTSFILAKFQDVCSREEAVAFGNVLMRQSLFEHVHNKYKFRDGNFFYQLSKKYQAPRPESKAFTSWFSSRKSVPATPLSESSKDLAATALQKRPKVSLSAPIQLNVDPRKRSSRPEVVTLHYDKLHNPENVFHIQLEWTNATAKLIEDTITSWALGAEKAGLRILQVPLGEISKIAEHNPLRQPCIVELAVKPSQYPAAGEVALDHAELTSTSGAQRLTTKSLDMWSYQRAFLRRLDYVLDFESSSRFPRDVDVSYSWSENDPARHQLYKYTQFIHRSGLLLVQIRENGRFALLANRLYHNFTGISSSMRDGHPPQSSYAYPRTPHPPMFPPPTSSRPTSSMHRPPSSHGLSGHSGPPTGFSSPILRKAHAQREQHAPKLRQLITAETLKDSFAGACGDSKALRAFYEEVLQDAEKGVPSSGRPTPSIRPADLAGDSGIPALELGKVLRSYDGAEDD
ncbi:MAG: vacuolar membrane-associated protein iml1 [Alyxoria varia]|nr:MAG: vacuolar membrane-associated protein iml1 [Alyxoria varia]